MNGKRYGHSEDLDAYLARTVCPALFGRLDSAFQEFGWELNGRLWRGTNVNQAGAFPESLDSRGMEICRSLA